MTGHRADGPVWKDTNKRSQKQEQLNKSIHFVAPSCARAPPTPTSSFSNPFCFHFSISLLLHAFPSLLSWGIYWVRQSAAVWSSGGGGRCGEGGYYRHRPEPNADPRTQTTLWLIPGPGPSCYGSPTVAGISPDKQLKEL